MKANTSRVWSILMPIYLSISCTRLRLRLSCLQFNRKKNSTNNKRVRSHQPSGAGSATTAGLNCTKIDSGSRVAVLLNARYSSSNSSDGEPPSCS